MDVRGRQNIQPYDDDASYWRIPVLHMLPHLAKLLENLRLVHVGVIVDLHLLPCHIPRIAFLVCVDFGL